MHHGSEPGTIKEKKKKAGKENSEYVLWVAFKPEYSYPKKTFCYFNDPPHGRLTLEMQKENLIRRVLHGSCEGRYKLAKLYQVGVERPIQEWQGEEENANSCNLYIICTAAFQERLKQMNVNHPVTVKGLDIDRESGLIGEDVALRSYRRLLSSKTYKGNFQKALVYLPDNKVPVASFDHRAHLTFLNQQFKSLIETKGNYPLYEMGIFDGYL